MLYVNNLVCLDTSCRYEGEGRTQNDTRSIQYQISKFLYKKYNSTFTLNTLLLLKDCRVSIAVLNCIHYSSRDNASNIKENK